MDILRQHFNGFVTISILYIVLSNFGYDFGVIGVFAKLIAVDSLYAGLALLGWESKNIINGTGLRYYCFFLICVGLWVFNLLTWWSFSNLVGFLSILIALPRVLLEVYEFFDYFTPIFAFYTKISDRFCEFVFYSIVATFANYLAKVLGLPATIEWKYMKAKLVGVAAADIKNALNSILRGFIAAKIGVPVWMPPRVVKGVCSAITTGIFGNGDNLGNSAVVNVTSVDLKMVNLAKNELAAGNYGILRKLIAADSWDVIMHKEIISYAVEFIGQSLSKGASDDMAAMVRRAKSAIYKYLAIYSIIYVVDIPGISLVLFTILFIGPKREDKKYAPRDGIWSLRFVMFLLAWIVGFSWGEQLAAISGFIGWFLGSSFAKWIFRAVYEFVWRKVHDLYFGFGLAVKEYNNPKILDLEYIRPTINITVIEYFSTLLTVYICGNPVLPPFVFKHSLLVMLLSVLGWLSSYNFVHLALISFIVYIVSRGKKPEKIGIKFINEYEVDQPPEKSKNNSPNEGQNPPKLSAENVILENYQNNLFNSNNHKSSNKEKISNLIFTIDDYGENLSAVKTQIMV